jgi:hypothetical protein
VLLPSLCPTAGARTSITGLREYWRVTFQRWAGQEGTRHYPQRRPIGHAGTASGAGGSAARGVLRAPSVRPGVVADPAQLRRLVDAGPHPAPEAVVLMHPGRAPPSSPHLFSGNERQVFPGSRRSPGARPGLKDGPDPRATSKMVAHISVTWPEIGNVRHEITPNAINCRRRVVAASNMAFGDQSCPTLRGCALIALPPCQPQPSP